MSTFDEQEHLRRLLDASDGPARWLSDHRDVIDRAAEVSRGLTAAGHRGFEFGHVDLVERLNERFAVQSEHLRADLQFETLARAALPVVPDIAHMPALSVSAMLPDRLRLGGIAEQMARGLPSFDLGPSTGPSWDARLEAQMAAVITPWVSTLMPELSFEGFAIVSRLGRAVRAPSPFDERVRERVDEDLGDLVDVDDEAGPEERDVAHVENGFAVSVLAIAPAAAPEVMLRCGLRPATDTTPMPATTDDSDPGLVFHPNNAMLITSVEQHLRRLITNELARLHGARWLKQGVSPAVSTRWRERREHAIAVGEPPLDPIQYADFMDLKDIILRKDHWSAAFGATFGSQQHFATSMERLHRIRLPLAHSRPIGRAQQLTLMVEAGTVLRALGVEMLSAGTQ